MKRLIAICIIFGLSLGFAAKSRAAYTIDADLSDWGVTPFSDWIPCSCSVDYIVTNNVNTYNVHGYTEKFDFEAFYFDNDIANFYFAIVSSYPMGTGESGGDLGLDFDNDHTISTHGVVTGLDHAIRICTGS
jgi:hypothetical protein